MDILKAFKLLNNENIEVNIKGTPEEPLFNAKQIGNIIGIKNIREVIKKYDDTERGYEVTDTLGGEQTMLYLTEIGLYKLLNRSNKPIAKVFQKWVNNVIKEIRINGEYKLKHEHEVDKALMKQSHEIKIHKDLINIFDKKNCIYVCRFRELENNQFIIKIGSTQNIKERVSHMVNNYIDIKPILLNVFEVHYHQKFENFLHNNEFIKRLFYSIDIVNSKKSKETYLVNNDEFLEIINIIKKNIVHYKNVDVLQLDLELTEKKIKAEELNIKAEELNIIASQERRKEEEIMIEKLKIQQMINEQELEKIRLLEKYDKKIDPIENEKILQQEINKISQFTKKIVKTNSNVPYVYQYLPDDLLKPVEKYDSPIDVERKLVNLGISPSALKCAYQNNTIYKDYRWYYCKRDEILPEKIPDTVFKKHKDPYVNYVAMLNLDKDKILEVYPNQKEATKARKMKAKSFTRAIKQQSLSSGHYWQFYELCSEKMKEEYLKHNTLPEKYVASNAIKIKQINPTTKEIVNTFNSKREVILAMKCSNLSLNKALENNSVMNGFLWNKS